MVFLHVVRRINPHPFLWSLCHFVHWAELANNNNNSNSTEVRRPQDWDFGASSTWFSTLHLPITWKRICPSAKRASSICKEEGRRVETDKRGPNSSSLAPIFWNWEKREMRSRSFQNLSNGGVGDPCASRCSDNADEWLIDQTGQGGRDMSSAYNSEADSVFLYINNERVCKQ